MHIRGGADPRFQRYPRQPLHVDDNSQRGVKYPNLLDILLGMACQQADRLPRRNSGKRLTRGYLELDMDGSPSVGEMSASERFEGEL